MSREIIVGDIHGCFDELMALLEKIGLKDEDKLISVGDIVDRGPKSKEVYEYFRDRPNSLVLMGNHERKHLRNVLSYSQEIVKVQFGSQYGKFVQWLTQLPYYYENEHLIVVHAALEDGVPLNEQKENVLAGTTSGDKYLQKIHPGKFWNQLYSGEKPVVFGHHVVGDEVKIFGDRVYGLDTGACHGGRLSALIVPGFEVVSVPVEVDYWVNEIRDNQVKVLAERAWAEIEWEKIKKDVIRFRRKEQEDVQQFLDQLAQWKQTTLDLYPKVVEALVQLQVDLLAQHGPAEFNPAAAKFPFRTYLFLARKGALTVEKLKASLKTPQKILALAKELGLADLPAESPLL